MIDSWAYLGEQLKNRLLDKETLIDYFQRNPKTIKELLQKELYCSCRLAGIGSLFNSF